jgi:hypothetical protein
MRIDDQHRTRVLAAVGFAFAAAVALAACPGKLDNGDDLLHNGEGGQPDCAEAPKILQMNCAGSACHSPPNPQEGLDLVSPDVGARLVDHFANGCAGNLADPTDPEGSVLYLKLGEMPPCGDRMPKDGTPLSDADMTCIRRWITRLQPTNTGGAGGTGIGGSGTGGTGTGGTGTGGAGNIGGGAG